MTASAEAAGGLRARNRQRTRRALTEAALRLFVEQGFVATTVEQVAAEAGVSARTAFRYFPTKEDLVLREYEAEMETWAAVLRRAPAGQPLLGALRDASLAVAADYERRAPFWDAVHHLLTTEPALAAATQATTARLVRRAAAEIAARLRVDPESDPRPLLLAAATFAAVNAGTARWYAGGKAVPRAAATTEAFAVLEGFSGYLHTPLP